MAAAGAGGAARGRRSGRSGSGRSGSGSDGRGRRRRRSGRSRGRRGLGLGRSGDRRGRRLGRWRGRGLGAGGDLDRLELLADLPLERAALVVLGRHRRELREVPASLHHVAAVLPRDDAALGEQERQRADVVADEIDAAVDETEQIAPLIARAHQLAELLERGLVGRLVREDVVEEPLPRLEVLVAGDPAPREHHREVGALGASERGQELVLRGLDLLGALLVGEQRLEQRGRGRVGRVAAVGLAEEPLGGLGALEPTQEARGAQEPADPPRAGRLVGLAEDRADALLPVVLRDLHVLERAARRRALPPRGA